MNPSKYENLYGAKQVGCIIPPTILLSEKELLIGNLEAVEAFRTAQNPNSRFIVRSAVTSEDGDKETRAGYFFSSEAQSGDELRDAVEYAYRENRRRADAISPHAHVHLMVSVFIDAEFGGVAFAPWLYFFNHAVIEYADTPQQVVSGESASKILNLANGSAEELIFERPLAKAISRLRVAFPHPIDIEWAYSNETLYVLQVRPAVIAPQALATKPYRELGAPAHLTLKPDNYSSILGKLSPLSFELLNTLYRDAKQYSEDFEIHGSDPFLVRLENGEVFSDPKIYRAYYANRTFMSPFKRALKRQKVLNTLTQSAAAWQHPDAVSYEHMVTAFSHWHTALAYEALGLRSRAVATFVGDYELSHPGPENVSTLTISAIWKKHFFDTLLSLRNLVRERPELAWSDFHDALKGNASSNWKERYEKEIDASIYSASFEVSSTASYRRISGSPQTAPAFVIRDPLKRRGALPHDRILVVPYIPASWIPELPSLLGIMACSLGILSHAAIVLREHHVSAAEIPADMLSETQDSDTVRIT